MKITRRLLSGSLIIAGIFCAALGLAQQNQNTTALAIAPQAEIRFPTRHAVQRGQLSWLATPEQ